MKNLNQENFENFSEYLLSDEDLLMVRGGDDDGKGQTIPPIVCEPEL